MPAEVIDREREVALLDAAGRYSTRSPARAIVYRAAFALLFDTGMRRAELLLCNVGDLHRRRLARIPNLKRRVKNRDHAKRRKLAECGQLDRSDVDGWRTIPLSWDAVGTWRFLAQGRPATAVLVPGHRENGRLTPNALYEAWRRTWVRSGLARTNAEVPPLKSTRTTYAQRLLRSGADIVTIKELLGHSKLASTQAYLQASMDTRMQAVDRAASMAVRRDWGIQETLNWPD